MRRTIKLNILKLRHGTLWRKWCFPGFSIMVIFTLFLVLLSWSDSSSEERRRIERIYEAVKVLKEEHFLEDSKNFTLYQAVKWFTLNHNLTDKVTLQQGFIRLEAVKLALELMEGHRFDVKLNDMKSSLKVLQTRSFSSQYRPDVCHNCNDFSQRVIINPEYICKGGEEVDLLILITTVPSSVEERRVIRSTWGSQTKSNTGRARYVFLYGTGWNREEEDIIISESLHYKDTLQYAYYDSYYNLPYKVMAGYQWALEHCQNAGYVIRTADDNYLGVPSLLTFIRSNLDNSLFLQGQIGHVLSKEDRQVYRLRDQKFYVPKNEYQRDFFPPFAVGTGFMFSMSSVEKVVKAAPNVPLLPLEDVWFGLILEYISMPVHNIKGFDLPLKSDVFVRKEFAKGNCPYGGKFYTIHETSLEDSLHLWRRCRLAEFKV